MYPKGDQMDEPYIFRAARRCMAGACVEVALGPGAVRVRDGKNRAGDVLAFGAAGWMAFIDDIKTDSVGPVSLN